MGERATATVRSYAERREPNYAAILSFAKGLLFDDLLQLGSPVAECKENVQRFKIMVKKVVAGAEMLTTRSRLEWWSTHTLPAHVRQSHGTRWSGDAESASRSGARRVGQRRRSRR